jgi:hypothetical protein
MTDTPQPPFNITSKLRTVADQAELIKRVGYSQHKPQPWQLPEHLRLSYSTDFDPETGIVTHTRELFGEVTHQFLGTTYLASQSE